MDVQIRSGMIGSVKVLNYQSLGDIDLEPGVLTVITGATGSGKSALIRALRLVFFNARGNSYVRRGTAFTMAGVGFADGGPGHGWSVAIQRHAQRGGDKYMVAPDGTADPVEYTKLAGGVPDAVAEACRITELNFAGQFDRPFLLTDSAAEVARILGQLTNVTQVFQAARLGQSRKVDLMARQRALTAELESLNEQRRGFAGLAARQQTVSLAEAALERASEARQRAAILRGLLSRVSAAQAVLDAPAPVPPPSLEAAAQAHARASWLRERLASAASAAATATEATRFIDTATPQLAAIDAGLHKLLEDAGTCPACGQVVPAR